MTLKEARTVIAALDLSGEADHIADIALNLQRAFPAFKWGLMLRGTGRHVLTVAPHRTRRSRAARVKQDDGVEGA